MTAAPGWWRRTLGLAATLVVAKAALVALRVVDGTARALATPFAAPAMLFEDAALVLGWVAIDGGAWLVGRRAPPTLRRAAVALAWAAYAVAAAYVAFNVPVARVFSSPLTFIILSAAGGALSDSIRIYVTPLNAAAIATVALAAVAAPWLVRRRPPSRAALAVALAGVGALAITGPLAARRVDLLALHRNAIVALASSTLAQRRAADRDALSFDAAPLVAEGAATDLTSLEGAARDRNVVWIVLESTAARYLAPYGAARDPTPRLTSLARRGLVFDAAYAAHPESIKGLFSYLCSTYPAAHTDADRYTAARLPCPSVAARVAEAGYHTALLHSGRFVYLGMQGVVDGRGFEHLADAGTVGGRFESSFGVDEPSTVRHALAWIDGLPPGRPFFLLYLPIAGHHPYNAPGEGPHPFAVASDQDAYENDLFRGDLSIGELLDGLHARGLDRRTLFVVHGDHGEAFQQHPGNFAHTLFLYEENVHVPLYLAAPGLAALDGGTVGELRGGFRRAAQVASLVDVAPTVMALLGLPAPAPWQGRSLLPARPGIARFFVDQAVWQVGLRDGPWKLIHEVESGRSRLFRLDADPEERTDISAREPERVARFRSHLLGWAARQRALVLDYRGQSGGAAR